VTTTLVALAGARFDLGVEAARVRRVVAAGEAMGESLEATATAIDLFALLGEPVTGAAVRLVALGLSNGDELWVAVHTTIEVVTPRALLPLPRIVTRGAPWLDALVLDAARPLLVIAPDRLRQEKPFPETTPLW
jgi:hypothetical protein